MTDDRVRHAAFNWFLDHPRPSRTQAEYEDTNEVRAIVRSMPVEVFFPPMRSVRRSLLDDDGYDWCPYDPSPAFTAVLTDTVKPAIQAAVRAGALYNFGRVPYPALRAGSAEALLCQPRQKDWVGLREWEGGIEVIFVRQSKLGFEAHEMAAVNTITGVVTLYLGYSAFAEQTEGGKISVTTATQAKDLPPYECARNATDAAVRPALFMATALADPRCTISPIEGFGHRVNTAPLTAGFLDA